MLTGNGSLNVGTAVQFLYIGLLILPSLFIDCNFTVDFAFHRTTCLFSICTLVVITSVHILCRFLKIDFCPIDVNSLTLLRYILIVSIVIFQFCILACICCRYLSTVNLFNNFYTKMKVHFKCSYLKLFGFKFIYLSL